jgi:hypothetical protein
MQSEESYSNVTRRRLQETGCREEISMIGKFFYVTRIWLPVTGDR